MNARGLMAAALVVLLAACSSNPPAPKGPERVGPGQASSDGTIAVVSVKLDLEGLANARGAQCELEMENRSKIAVKRDVRVVYFSHTGAELLYPQETWIAVELAAGERRAFTHTCPFRAAKEAKVEVR